MGASEFRRQLDTVLLPTMSWLKEKGERSLEVFPSSCLRCVDGV